MLSGSSRNSSELTPTSTGEHMSNMTSCLGSVALSGVDDILAVSLRKLA